MLDEASQSAPDGTTPPTIATARSLDELFALLKEFEQADSAPTEPGPCPFGEKTDTPS